MNDYIDHVIPERFKCPGGQKPMPLKSSWHMHERTPPTPRKPVTWFFLDCIVTGNTLARTKSKEDAWRCLEDLRKSGVFVSIREETITEEWLQLEESYRRKVSQLGAADKVQESIPRPPRREYIVRKKR